MVELVDASAIREGGDAVDMARLFAEAFDLPSVGVDDNFFELGGDSLIGQSLIAAVEGRFGIVVSLSALLEAPTPAQLARRIGGGRQTQLPAHVIGVNPDGEQPTVFLVHGTAGESIAPLELSRAFGGRAFWAIRALGLEEGEVFLTSMKEFVERYIADIRRVQPEGDVILMGHCGGAIIAYEIAQQLTAAGRPPLALILIDPDTKLELAPYLHHSGLALSLLQSSWLKRGLALDGAIGEGVRDGSTDRQHRRAVVEAGIMFAIGTYAPKPYDGATLLLYTDERRDLLLQARRGYPAMVRDLETARLSMAHDDMFKDGVPEIAAASNRFIDALRAGRSP